MFWPREFHVKSTGSERVGSDGATFSSLTCQHTLTPIYFHNTKSDHCPSVQFSSVAQSCLTLCNPTDSSPPGSTVCGDSPGKNIGVGCHFLLQGIFSTQGLNPGLPHCRWILYQLSHQGRLLCSIGSFFLKRSFPESGISSYPTKHVCLRVMNLSQNLKILMNYC